MALLRPRLVLRIYLVGLLQLALVLLGFALLMWNSRAAARNLRVEAHAAIERVVASLGDPRALARELERVEHDLDGSIVVYDDDGQVLATNRRHGDVEPPSFPEPPILFRGGPPKMARGPAGMPGGHGQPGGREVVLGLRGRPLMAPGLPLPSMPKMLLDAPLPGDPPTPAFGHGALLPPDGPAMIAFMMPIALPGGHTGRAFYASRDTRPLVTGYIIGGFVLVVVGLASFFTARSLAKPLTRLSVAARRFGGGELETRVRLDRADEIGEVAHAFDEMAERIAHLVRAEKELMANVSHELRTPLARIRVALDLAAEGDAEVARQSLREIAEDLGELEQLISDVLVASRLDLARAQVSTASGGFPLHKEHVEVANLIDKAAARFRSAHPDRMLGVETVPAGARVDGDAVLLRRALENLLENAHKYTVDPREPIHLRTGVESGFVWIEVRDHGIGIAPEDLRHVFVPFFRSDKSRARATGGFGLGLAIVKQVALAHGGVVDIESEIGKGTRVRLRLPLATIV